MVECQRLLEASLEVHLLPKAATAKDLAPKISSSSEGADLVLVAANKRCTRLTVVKKLCSLEAWEALVVKE